MSEDAKIAVFQVLMQIPAGNVVTYGHLAKLAGLGKAARFVGTTMRNLPKDTRLPWHRVINSQGKISLPTNHPGRTIQENRLMDEGVIFIKGKVDLKRYLWTP